MFAYAANALGPESTTNACRCRLCPAQLLFFIHQEDPSAVAFVSIEAMPNCMSTSIQIFVMSLNHFNLSKASA